MHCPIQRTIRLVTGDLQKSYEKKQNTGKQIPSRLDCLRTCVCLRTYLLILVLAFIRIVVRWVLEAYQNPRERSHCIHSEGLILAFIMRLLFFVVKMLSSNCTAGILLAQNSFLTE